MARHGKSAAIAALLLLFAIAGLPGPRIAAAGGTEVFVYKTKHRVAEELMSGVRAGLSPAGRASVDARTNSIIIIDTPQGLETVKAILATQDVRQHNIQITVETVRDRDLRARHASVDWAYRDSGWQIGTIPFPVAGSGVTALGTLGDEDSRSRRGAVQTLTVMNNGTAEIATGQHIPYTDVFHHYAAGHGYIATNTRWVAVDTGFTVHARTIGADRILLELTPWMRNLSGGGPAIDVTEATTQIEVKDGEPVVLGSSTRNRNETLRSILRGGARVREGENTYLMVTARKR
ncbi:MAG: secretin N-terminal domain-containing protein [Myxococcota bacterium]